ncbi:MAG: RecX family transcriptional regulator [Bacteroidota bacterium]|nr:RecX family transcriptional regulator [Bacteroidota bacterium]
MEHKSTKKHTPKEAFPKICRFCAYQERTQQQVRDKLYELGLNGDDVENIISTLITENFINEERFAKSYASGKFRNNHWGRIKIKQGLKAEKISEYCIKKGLLEISNEDYSQTLRKLISKKSKEFSDKNPLIKKHKVANYLIGKGYEQDLVWDFLNQQ